MNKFLRCTFLLVGMTVFAQNQIPGQLDPTFQIGTGFEDGMDAIAVQPDGKIIVAGQGDTYRDVPFKRIIRLNADGSPDPTFNGPDLLIYENYNSIVLQPDGKILALSHYTTDVNSTTPYYHFKRLNTDGSLDTTFNAGGIGVVETPSSWIDVMAVMPDGKIMIGGQFAQYNGVASKNIARLNADGTLDTTFNVGTGFNSSIYSFCAQPDGKVIVSGGFSSYNGSSASSFIRLNTDGTKDTTFTPDRVSGVGKMALQSNGNIVISGGFTSISGVSRSDLAILNPNGVLIPTGGTPPGITGASNERILDFAVQPDDKIIVVGYFTQWGGVNKRHILRLSADGFLDNTFSSGTPSAMVQAITAYPGDRYIISGLFTRYASQTMNYVARINGLSNIQTPTGNAAQTICGSGTLASLSVTGTAIQWYAAASGGNSLSSATPLVDGTTYYASQTVSGNESANRLAVTVTITAQLTSLFDQVGPLCSGASGYSLPTTSTNGVTGTWSPNFSSSLTRTYTFTPATGQCGTSATMTVTVISNVTSTFTQLAAICSGADLVLPTTSNNGITGTWSPAANNSATTTYTFTPDPGQCGRTATMTVAVNTATVPAFTQVAAICSGTTLSALPVNSTNGINGSWSPALNNLETTTYTFTPANGQCATTAIMTITVNDQFVPSFTQVAAICSGTTLSALPVTSTNGINGSWSPALNNLETTTYTFTPTAGQCATSTTMTITVNDQLVPSFTQVAAICSGTTLSALPVNSTNGISGSWSPALNNLETTTYTFTPAVGQCATSATMTITVNDQVVPAFTSVASICSGSTLSALPVDSINGINGSWSPALNNLETTTYTFTPAAGQCAMTATMTIAVNDQIVPAFTSVAEICSGATLSALPVNSTNGISGSWSPALNNLETTTYTFTPTAGQCATTATMTITVNDQVLPAFAQVAAICLGSTLSALPVDSTNGINGSWSPALNNLETTTYTFTPTAGQCATTSTMTITVNDQVVPAFAQVAAICSGTTLSALPVDSTNGINGSWSPALNILETTTYTFTPTAGQCATSATMTITVNDQVLPAFAQVAAICSGSTLSALPVDSTNGINGSWSPALNNLETTTYTFIPAAGQCATTATMTITVNDQVLPAFAQVAAICSGTTLSALPVDSTNGINGSWSPSLNNLETTTYTFTPATSQCATSTTMTITVNNQVLPAFTSVAAICSGSTLSALPVDSTNGINGSWSPALNNLETTTYTFTPTAGQCATAATMTITVNDQVVPAFTSVAAICSGSTLSALPVDSTNGINGSWSPALNNLETTTYTFTPTAGQCATTATMTITVNNQALPEFTSVAAICSGSTLSALPVDSTNGINGSWSPALNNLETTTYTFTPATGQCATSATMTITVNDQVLPAFTQVAAICSGSTLSALPVDSTNGINGSWSPALNNLETTTYTFTPAAGQCAAAATMVIAVTTIPAPTGPQTQTITAAELGQATIADLEVTGENVRWFATAEQALAGQFPLDAAALLQNGATYYAMQTINGCTSVAPLAVTVSVALGLQQVTNTGWKVYPNPTADFVMVDGSSTINEIKVFSILGQLVSGKKYNTTNVQVDLSGLPAAVYFVEVHSGNASSVYRIVKR